MYSLDKFKKLPKIGKLSPKAMGALQAWDKLALAAGAIPKKYKELMAIAVALTKVSLLHRGAPPGRRQSGRYR